MQEKDKDIVYCEMPDGSDMIADAKQQAKAALEQKDSEKDASLMIKQFFDTKYSPTWHCIVGKHFSAYVSYESKNYIFFYEGQTAILLYKLG